MTLNAAVIGAGEVSDTHLTGLRDGPLTTLSAVCDLNESRAREKAKAYGINWYTDLEGMLDAEDLDWLHLCTPVQTHLELALVAIEAGIPVQIEKPVTETRDEVKRLAEAASAAGVPVSVVHQHNFDLAMRHAMTAVESGEIGDVVAVDLQYIGETPPDRVNRGAWAFDLLGGEFEEGLPHPLYLLLRAGGYPRATDDIRVQTTRRREYDRGFAYDGVQLQYRSGENVLCSATIAAGSTHQRIIQIHGEDGALLADFVSQTLVRLDRNYQASSIARALNNVDRIRDRFAGTVGNIRAVVARQFGGSWETRKELNSHYYQFDEEARALLDGREVPVPLSEGRWTIELMEAAREDARVEMGSGAPTVQAKYAIPED